jgi:hypothetical protein
MQGIYYIGLDVHKKTIGYCLSAVSRSVLVFLFALGCL